jgi:hypothetical protein
MKSTHWMKCWSGTWMLSVLGGDGKDDAEHAPEPPPLQHPLPPNAWVSEIWSILLCWGSFRPGLSPLAVKRQTHRLRFLAGSRLTDGGYGSGALSPLRKRSSLKGSLGAGLDKSLPTISDASHKAKIRRHKLNKYVMSMIIHETMTPVRTKAYITFKPRLDGIRQPDIKYGHDRPPIRYLRLLPQTRL